MAELTIERAFEWHGLRTSGDQPITELDACSLVFANYDKFRKRGWTLSKPDTFWRMASIYWPKTPDAKIWVEPNPWAERMINAACENRLLSCSGCASSGKSFTLGAAWAFVNWSCSWHNTKIVI